MATPSCSGGCRRLLPLPDGPASRWPFFCSEPLKDPTQNITPRQRHADKSEADAEVLLQPRLEAEPGEDDDLGDDCQGVADDDVRGGLNHRHAARLGHLLFRIDERPPHTTALYFSFFVCFTYFT